MPLGGESFYETVRHEIAHGLGFATYVDDDNGTRLQNLDDSFMLFLEDHSTGKKWSQMTNGERAASEKDAGDLHWTGAAVVGSSSALTSGRHPSGHVRMYAPNPVEPGSSASHWDAALSPDEMMEPFATANPSDLLTTKLLQDIGWTLQTVSVGPCVRDAPPPAFKATGSRSRSAGTTSPAAVPAR